MSHWETGSFLEYSRHTVPGKTEELWLLGSCTRTDSWEEKITVGFPCHKPLFFPTLHFWEGLTFFCFWFPASPPHPVHDIFSPFMLGCHRKLERSHCAWENRAYWAQVRMSERLNDVLEMHSSEQNPETELICLSDFMELVIIITVNSKNTFILLPFLNLDFCNYLQCLFSCSNEITWDHSAETV